ncbi:hypothetical protein DFQ28_000230 [Apophysomyces sp. BC1034]|nr:hypothetical protein DFQ30_001385 [Apophysomyces sp. BC1015]KAG0180983.1 hypothetical protein DFQ29_009671 [Apophysomyces sp. BC1021]KAG0191408.1 hypothetical protein DFQ28_000230 [Apophysomyces sp. BC1034]
MRDLPSPTTTSEIQHLPPQSPTSSPVPKPPAPGNSAPRFSVNSNLMNYSIPQNGEQESKNRISTGHGKREIQEGNSSTRTRQLEAQIEALTLQNVKLQRTNRLLKVDTDNLIEQKTQPLEEHIRKLTLVNVQLQRATRLLQQEVDEKADQFNKIQQEQIVRMKNVGPEYEFLVQMINLLQRQISGEPTCEDTCCFTLEPIDQSSMVMTLPPENDDDEMQAQHVCRPVIHSSISQGSYAIELENKIMRLEQVIEELDVEKEHMTRQHAYKDNDVETLKRELHIKDEIVSQLEQDFLILEDQLARLQKELNDRNSKTITPVSKMVEERVRNPRHQSQLLMETKRRSLAIKDTDMLEQMLRGDLGRLEDGEDVSEEEEDDGSLDDDSDKDTKMTTPPRSLSPQDTDKPMMAKMLLTQESTPHFPSRGHIPGAYPGLPGCSNVSDACSERKDSFAPFTLMAILLGLSSQFGITDDWTVPITMAALVSGFLWSGAARGVQLKLKLQ